MTGRGDARDDSARGVHPSLAISTSTLDGTVTVAFEGDVDIGCAGRVAEALMRAVEDGEARAVADLCAVTFLGSTGVRLLFEAGEEARRLDKGFAIRLGASPARRAIELLGVADRMEILDPGGDAGA